jgi:hypothetical protein
MFMLNQVLCYVLQVWRCIATNAYTVMQVNKHMRHSQIAQLLHSVTFEKKGTLYLTLSKGD